jgi:hypothetical protein
MSTFSFTLLAHQHQTFERPAVSPIQTELTILIPMVLFLCRLYFPDRAHLLASHLDAVKFLVQAYMAVRLVDEG